MAIQEILGVMVLIIGVSFSCLGVIGVWRLPDSFSRLHATGKTGTLGILFLCGAAALLMPIGTQPSATFKLLALSVFIIFSGPVTAHAIADAIHRRWQKQGADPEAATYPSDMMSAPNIRD